MVYDKIVDKLKERRTDIQGAIILESELSPVAKRIDEIRAYISQYDNLIAMSTITVNLYSISWKLLLQDSLKAANLHFLILLSGLIKSAVRILPGLLGIALVIFIGCLAILIIIKVIKNIFRKKGS